ncbi:MAG: DUF3931 domain-containing protein [Bacillaceae bacterium]
MDKDDKKLVSIDGGKKKHANENLSVLQVDGEEYKLRNFVLAGEDENGKRVLLTWQLAIDELLAYSKIIDIIVAEKVKRNLI